MAIMTIRERHTPGSEVSHVELEYHKSDYLYAIVLKFC